MATKQLTRDGGKAETAIPTPYFDVDALLKLQHRNFDTLVEANKIFVATAREIARCQSEIMRDCVEHMSRAFSDMASASEPGSVATREAAIAKTLFEKTAGHVREIAELLGKSNADTIELVNTRVRALMEETRSGDSRPARDSAAAE